MLIMDDCYQIVLVKDRKFKNKDPIIVPNSYITTNDQLQSYVRYIEPPYSEDDKELIEGFVKNKSVPPESWGSFKCETKVVARTYEKALEALKSSNEKAQEKAAKATSSTRRVVKSRKPKPPFIDIVKTLESEVKIKMSEATLEHPYDVRANENTQSGTAAINDLLNSVPSLDESIEAAVGSEDVVNRSTSPVVQVTAPDNNIKNECVENEADTSEDGGDSSNDTQPVTESNSAALSSSFEKVEQKDTEVQNGPFPNSNSDINITNDKADESSNGRNAQDGPINNPSSPVQVSEFFDVSSQIATKDDFAELKGSLFNYLKGQNAETLSAFNHLKGQNVELMLQLTDMKSQVKDVLSYVKKNCSKNGQTFYSFDSFKEECIDCKFPLEKDTEFLAFDELIKRNVRNVKDNLKKHLICIINPVNDLVDTTRDIIKKFFTKEVLSLYVPQKKTGTKKIFKNTSFYLILQESISTAWLNADQKIEEGIILKALGVAFSTVKDWGKGRFERMKVQDENIS